MANTTAAQPAPAAAAGPAAARPLLSPTLSTDAVKRQQAAFNTPILDEVRREIAANDVLVVGMSVNPFCRNVRNFLNEQKVPFKYLEYGGYFSQWNERLAIKMWSGWPTFPQVFVKGKLVGGFSDTQSAFQDGTWTTLMATQHQT